jgi:hypothetical protein
MRVGAPKVPVTLTLFGEGSTVRACRGEVGLCRGGSSGGSVSSFAINPSDL